MDTTQAQQSIKSLNSELMSLNPSALIQLFEIDVSQIALNNGIVLSSDEQIFRFHNHVKLSNTNIIWKNQQYIATPIQAVGFEINGQGTLPVPKLSISVNDGGVTTLALFKNKLRQFGDLAGAKVTRTRTFARFLDAANFPDGNTPNGFATDEFAEFPPDIYYIDRKSNENKNGLEFELASILDIEGIKLPARIVNSYRCTWNYRGEGCLYSGPTVANEFDENVTDIVGTIRTNRGAWMANQVYNLGDEVYITINNINYNFVARQNGITSIPPNSQDWFSDICSKSLRGCRLRFSKINNGNLPFGGFPAVSKLTQ